MGALLRAEALKARTGKAWWILLAIAIPWSLIVCLGESITGVDDIEKGATTQADLTAEIARQWFQMLLFTALFGSVLVGREFSGKSITRSALLTSSRTELIKAKVIVSIGAGAVYGLIAAALAVGSAWFFLVTNDLDPQWTSDLWTTVLGVFAVSVLAAPWGVLLGWIGREQIVAVGAVLGLTLLVEPGLQALSPDVFNFPFSIALSAIYQDTKEGLLSVPVAAVVSLAWLAAAGVAAVALTRRRDIA